MRRIRHLPVGHSHSGRNGIGLRIRSSNMRVNGCSRNTMIERKARVQDERPINVNRKRLTQSLNLPFHLR